jgi:hypothetical protein
MDDPGDSQDEETRGGLGRKPGYKRYDTGTARETETSWKETYH